jgi:hypothetical protein
MRWVVRGDRCIGMMLEWVVDERERLQVLLKGF